MFYVYTTILLCMQHVRGLQALCCTINLTWLDSQDKFTVLRCVEGSLRRRLVLVTAAPHWPPLTQGHDLGQGQGQGRLKVVCRADSWSVETTTSRCRLIYLDRGLVCPLSRYWEIPVRTHNWWDDTRPTRSLVSPLAACYASRHVLHLCCRLFHEYQRHWVDGLLNYRHPPQMSRNFRCLPLLSPPTVCCLLPNLSQLLMSTYQLISTSGHVT